jgi:serine/threonine-protein kinase
MAQIMEATARGMDGFERRVAIKRLLPEHARNGEHRRMFLQEARITSRLHHGGIVGIFDYGLIDGSAFLAMEFIDGLDALRALSSTADQRPMPEGIALHLVAEIGHALAYIHELRDEHDRPLQIVHRDVSPQNILLSWDGDVRLSDFGIASSYWRRELTTVGAIKGKLRFMAPEQARGERVGPAADVYALGATLDAFVGSRATGPSTSEADTARRVQKARRRNVSPAVCELIGACLASEPDQRPRAGEVAARAGVLASQRLGRDGRGALRAWLGPLRAIAKRNSKLDDLMGLCLVPVGPASARTFTVTQESPLPELEQVSVVRRLPTGRPPTAVRSPEVLLAAAALASLLIAGETRLSFPGLASASPPTTGVTRGRSAPPNGNSPRLFPSSRLAAPHAHQVPPPPPQSDTAAPAPSPAVDHRDTAWLRVGGPTLAGARVSIDGTFAGFAPVELFRPCGTHKVAVTEPTSGRTLLRKTVRLGDQHTRAAPLRIVQ